LSSEIRISGGFLKGESINVLRKGSYRITMEQARKSLFDTLGEKVPNSIFMDLFAGSGIVGIEALSYRAEKVVFVEKYPLAIKMIRENLKRLSLEEKSEVFCQDVFMFLRKIPIYKFDIIFADPPYDIEKNINNIVKYISDNSWLKENGILIIEHHKKTILEENFEDLKLLYEKRMGETSFSYFSYKGE